jgi:hypothetical protein
LPQTAGRTSGIWRWVIRGRRVEDFANIDIRIKAAPLATFNDGINDGTALAGLGVADEAPVFLAEGGGWMAFSTRLLSIFTRPSFRQTVNVSYWQGYDQLV